MNVRIAEASFLFWCCAVVSAQVLLDRVSSQVLVSVLLKTVYVFGVFSWDLCWYLLPKLSSVLQFFGARWRVAKYYGPGIYTHIRSFAFPQS